VLLVRAAEAAHRVAFEMRQDQQRIVARHMVADRHLREPLAALDRHHGRAVLVHDVDGRKRPAICRNRLAVLLRRVAAALVIRVRLDNGRIRQTAREEFPDPRARDDVRPVRLARMELHADLARERARDAVIHLREARR